MNQIYSGAAHVCIIVLIPGFEKIYHNFRYVSVPPFTQPANQMASFTSELAGQWWAGHGVPVE